VLTEALAAGGDEAKRAFDAMMGTKKIDVAAIKAARLMFTTKTSLSRRGCETIRISLWHASLSGMRLDASNVARSGALSTAQCP
jgi:hypothetical protein